MASKTALPAAQYLFTTGQVRANYGGQTLSMMRRAKLFAEAGTPVAIMTVDSWYGYPALREEWAEEGVTAEGVTILNIHEDYRVGDIHHLLTGAAVRRREPKVLQIPMGFRPYENPVDGKNMKRFWYPEGSKQHRFTEYLRPDRSVFMRTLSNPGVTEWELPERPVGFYDTEGTFVGAFGSHQAWWAHWIGAVSAGNEPTVIVNDYEHPLFLGLGARPGVRKVQVIHSAHSKGADPLGPVKERWEEIARGHEPFDTAVFLTEAQRDDWVRKLPSDILTAVIPHSVHADAAANLPDARGLRCVIVSRLDDSKNVAASIKAFDVALSRSPQAYLDIYGDGPARKKLEELVSALGIGDKVTFHGHLVNAAAEFATARLALFTSKSEGFGLTILEALTRGCPVLAFDVRYGPSDMIEDGGNGYLIPDGGVGEMASRLGDLLTDDALAERLSKQAVSSAEKFSEAAFVQRWADLVEAVPSI
ncbi:glycosyltransferase [Arthrobacter sp. YAF16]|uniref:glycosyltransferase n=1 Tax=Arthrobacter sp. YAF16 TaxID=3233076 RepID=UPI003F902F93